MVSDPMHDEREVEITSGKRTLRGILVVPRAAKGVVAFAHGSGSGRSSPRNHSGARFPKEAVWPPFLLALQEKPEWENREKVSNTTLLPNRPQIPPDWLKRKKTTAGLPLGYFGASTGA